jgi:hypothetical protein
MTRFGVPDDDMPDNLPPSGWGPASSDERDLDAVLAGQMADIPIALRPVADVLAALRASPAPAELWGEANVMAEFRAHGPGGVARPMGPAPTRPLSALPDGPAPRRRPTRRRGRRKTARPVVSHWAGALTGIAAAVAIVIVVAFTGNLPANLERLAHLGPTAKPSAATASPQHSQAQKTETSSASKQPTTSPPATHSTGATQSEDTAACRAYYGDYMHPQSLVTEKSLWQQLTTLADSPSPRQVYQFCLPYLDGMFPHWMPELGHYPAAPDNGTGNQGSNQPASQTNPPAQNNSGGPNDSSGQNGQGAQSDSHPANSPVQPRPSTNSVSP